MPVSAKIIIQQLDSNITPGSRDDLVLSIPVTLLNQDNTSVTSWAWSIVDRPTGSFASLVSPTSSTTTFTPDVVGTYLIKLVLNGGAASDQKGAAIKTANFHYRIPAATETTEFSITRGWAIATNLALQLLDDGYSAPHALGNLQTDYNATIPAVIQLNSTSGGLQIHDTQTPLGSNLFEVDAYSSITKYFTITPSASTFLGQILQTNGKIGLGTLNPGGGYGFSGDVNVHSLKSNHNFILLETSTINSDTGLILQTRTANNGSIFIDESDSQKLKIALGDVDNDGYRNSNTKLTIQQNGFVGIGTTTPDSLLHIAGLGHFTATLTLDGGFSSGAQSSMGNFKITALATPNNPTDAANKAYVDAQISSAGILQTIYNNSIPAEIILNSTNGALVIQDGYNHLGGQQTKLFSIDAYGNTSSYAQIVREGLILQPESGSTIAETTGAAFGVNYNTLWGTSTSNIYVGGFDPSGSKQQLAHFNGSAWSVLSTYPGAIGDSINSIFGFASNDIYIGVSATGGGPGGIWHTTNNGSTWTQQYSTKGINAIWGINNTNIYAIPQDNSGIVLFSNGGGSWSPVIGTNGSVFSYAIWGVSSSEFWVGTGSSIRHTTDSGNTFNTQFDTNVNSTDFSSLGYSVSWHSIWGTASNNIYAIGSHGSNGYIAFYNGTYWTLQLSTYTDTFNSVYGTSANDVYVCGDQSLFYNNGNGVWIKQQISAGLLTGGVTLNAIWAPTYNDWFIATSNTNPVAIYSLKPQGADINASGIANLGTIITNNIQSPTLYNNKANTLAFTSFVSSNNNIPDVAFNFDTTQLLQTNSANNRLVSFKNDGYEVFTINGDGYFQVPNIGAFNLLGTTTPLWSWDAGTLTIPSFITVDGYKIAPAGAQFGQGLVFDGYAFTPGSASAGGGSVANNINALLTTTGAVAVLSYTPPETNNYVVYVYYTVSNAPTGLSIIATWNDPTGPQSFTLLSHATQSIGSYHAAPLYLDAAPSAAITIIPSADIANNVSISTSIVTLANTTNITNKSIIDQKSSAFDTQITTTSPTTILSYTPITNANHVVYVYYRVANTTTTVSITINWNDNSGSQTLSILSSVSKTVGSYSVVPTYIQATTGGTVSVIATSGTSNNLFISATIISV